MKTGTLKITFSFPRCPACSDYIESLTDTYSEPRLTFRCGASFRISSLEPKKGWQLDEPCSALKNSVKNVTYFTMVQKMLGDGVQSRVLMSDIPLKRAARSNK